MAQTDFEFRIDVVLAPGRDGDVEEFVVGPVGPAVAAEVMPQSFDPGEYGGSGISVKLAGTCKLPTLWKPTPSQISAV